MDETSRTLLLDMLDSSSSDEDASIITQMRIQDSEKNKRMWVERHITFKREHGEFHLFYELSDGKFLNYFRMNRETFHHIHSLIADDIKKVDTYCRKAITTEERLAVCLRYLATGDSFTTIAYNYRIGKSTVSTIVEEVCGAIWKHLQPTVMAEPTQEGWKKISKDFKEICQFDHCVGAIDGKHVVIKAPPNSGSDFRNYKHAFSIVLLAVADARRKFIIIDTGSMGRFSDGGILTESQFGQKLKSGNLQLPEQEPLHPGGVQMPYVFVGDEAFPLMTNLMRAYPRVRLTESRKIFNYRLCRARRVVENAFGILSARWRVYGRAFECKIELVDKIVKATCVLHNFLMDNNNTQYNIGDETIAVEGGSQLTELRHSGFRSSNENFFIREEFCRYFNTVGSVPWQATRIQQRLDRE